MTSRDINDHLQELSPEELQRVNKEISALNASKHSKVIQALRGVATLQTMKPAPAKQFALVYHQHGNVVATNGVAYPGYDIKDENRAEELDKPTVFLQIDDNAFIDPSYSTLSALEKDLKDHDIPYVINFFDK